MVRIIAALLIVLVVAGGWAADGDPAKSPTLEAKELVYDAGRVPRGVTLAHTFLLRNVGTAELSIDAEPG